MNLVPKFKFVLLLFSGEGGVGNEFRLNDFHLAEPTLHYITLRYSTAELEELDISLETLHCIASLYAEY